jgi:hypothetical protein
MSGCQTHLSSSRSIRESIIDISPSSPLLPLQLDPEGSRLAEMTGLGLSIEGVLLSSTHGLPLPYRTTTRASPGSTPSRRAGSIRGQSPIMDDTPPRYTPASQPQGSPSYLGSTAHDLTQSRGRMSMVDGYDGDDDRDDDAPSPHNVPLPSSPPTSITSSALSASHLQAQPRHRLTPQMTFYPSLAPRNDSDDDPSRTPLLDPSGLDIIPFGLPTPALSPNQVPAAARSPSADPRSPIARWTRIPMELSRFVFFFRTTFGTFRSRVAAFFVCFLGTSFLVALRLRGMVRE